MQLGLVTTQQLLAAGLSSAAISKRARSGKLYRIHQGVYSVGHQGLSEPERWMAAVLACGPGAVLSHGAAAVHWGLLRPLEGPIDITVPTQNGRRPRHGVRIHRCASLDGTVAFEDDRERDLRLRRLGYSVHRFSEQQLEIEPAAVVEDVVRALGR